MDYPKALGMTDTLDTPFKTMHKAESGKKIDLSPYFSFEKVIQTFEEINKVSNKELNFFSLFILEFSNDMPFFYGLFSIMFAIFLGVGAAFLRRFFSNLRKKILLKS